MRTLGLAIIVATTAILLAGCSSDGGSDATSTATEPATTAVTTVQTPPPVAPAVPPVTIASWASASNTGPWTPRVALKLPKDFGIPTSFYVCSVWKHAASRAPCRATPGLELPAGETLRLEQQPIGPAVTNPDTPGWGTVATSEQASLSAVLSNFVTGNKPGTYTYRTTLRDAAGQILARSNPVKVTWHK